MIKKKVYFFLAVIDIHVIVALYIILKFLKYVQNVRAQRSVSFLKFIMFNNIFLLKIIA